jgi:hypothetical protein
LSRRGNKGDGWGVRFFLGILFSPPSSLRFLRQNFSGQSRKKANNCYPDNASTSTDKDKETRRKSEGTAMVKTLAPITEALLTNIVIALRRADPEVVSVVLFGSAVYAPDLARDLDFLVISHNPKEQQRYQDAALQVAQGWEVDVIVCKVGEKVRGLAGAVRAFGKVLWGDERWLWEVTKDMPVPTFEDARRTIREAEMDAQRRCVRKMRGMPTVVGAALHNWLFERCGGGDGVFEHQESRWGVLRGQCLSLFRMSFGSSSTPCTFVFGMRATIRVTTPNGTFRLGETAWHSLLTLWNGWQRNGEVTEVGRSSGAHRPIADGLLACRDGADGAVQLAVRPQGRWQVSAAH